MKRPVICPCGFAYDANRFMTCPQADYHTRAEEAARIERLNNAAPDLLTALKDLSHAYDHKHDEQCRESCLWADAEKAINLAEGIDRC